ncbi:MAG: extracellular solute-binding protein [Candidatus Atribacteria bacterium]|nr:extracellular solute-binding protein [Candidatus Atribacteria bacterium]
MKYYSKSILFLTLIVLALLLSVSIGAISQEKTELIVIGHQVHLNAVTAQEVGAKGVNLIEEFEALHPNVKVVYQTYSSPKVREKMNLLGPLNRTEEDLIHVVDNWFVPVVAKFLEPLDKYLVEKPLEDYPNDYPENLLSTTKIDGSPYGIPVRVSYNGVYWVNTKILDEIGVAYQPTITGKEFYELAKKGTYTRPSGEKVYGYVYKGVVGMIYEVFDVWARFFGSNKLVTEDFKPNVNSPGAIEGLTYLQKLYQEGAIPPDVYTYADAELMKTFMENHSLFSAGNTSYGVSFNDPSKSKIAGYAVMTEPVLSPEMQAQGQHYRGQATMWSLGILKGSQKKDLAWEYIQFVASKRGALSMGLSGNTPVRVSVLNSPQYTQNNPAAQIEASIAPYAETIWPPFDRASEAIDLIGNYCHDVIFKGQPVQKSVDQLAKELQALLP